MKAPDKKFPDPWDVGSPGARFFVVGGGCKPQKAPSFFLVPIAGRCTVRLRFSPPHQAAEQRWTGAPPWKATAVCLDRNFERIAGNEQDAAADGSDETKRWRDLTVTAGADARCILVRVTSEDDEKAVGVRLTQIDPEPAIPAWLAKPVQMRSFLEATAFLRKFRDNAAREEGKKKHAAAVDRGLATWANIRDLVPQSMQQILTDSLLDWLAYRQGEAAGAPGERFQSVRELASNVTDKKAAAIIECLCEEGLGACLNELYASVESGTRRAGIFERIGNMCSGDIRDTVLFYWLAYGSDPSIDKAAKLGCKMFIKGDITSAAALARLAETLPRTPMVGEIELSQRLQARLESRETIPKPVSRPVGARRSRARPKVAYVASSVQPWAIVGYTIRTHELLRALVAEGIDAECFVRPGYPWDRMAIESTAQELNVLDGVRYHCRQLGGVEKWGAEFIDKSAECLATQFENLNVDVVHAASNNRNALPALMAARRLGLPFVYEIRGLWELTQASKKSWWEGTERYALDRELEHVIAAEADLVFAITDGVAQELIGEGLPADKVSLLPNAVDPERFGPLQADPALVAQYGLGQSDLVLVYAGTLMNYEGMDDVVNAIALLRAHGLRLDFLMIGTGPMLPELQKQVADLGLDARVQFLGPKPPDEVRGLLALADVVALPRKAFRVCEIVSPLKPFEAMAMGKPVVLSDLKVSREIVRDGVTGLLCRPDDPGDLAARLELLAKDAALRTRLGHAAREWILQARTWSSNAKIARSAYEGLLLGKSKSASRAPIGGRSTKAKRRSTTPAGERLN